VKNNQKIYKLIMPLTDTIDSGEGMCMEFYGNAFIKRWQKEIRKLNKKAAMLVVFGR
jgi:hypothetical protein